MNKQKVMEHLQRMLREQFQIDDTSLTPETRQSDIGIDSILMVNLMLDIENELGFSFDIMDLPKNPSLGEICDLVIRNLK
jgi:acyl carrier protein